MEQAIPTHDEVAAALLAITLYLAEEDTVETPQPSGWQASIKLTQQQIAPVRATVQPGWGTIERLRRL